MCECAIKSGLSSGAVLRWVAAGSVTIAQLKCQQVRLPAQSNYSGQRFQRVIGTEPIREPGDTRRGAGIEELLLAIIARPVCAGGKSSVRE